MQPEQKLRKKPNTCTHYTAAPTFASVKSNDDPVARWSEGPLSGAHTPRDLSPRGIRLISEQVMQ